jgi:hypothetical protein
MELDGLPWKTAVTRLSPSTSRVDLHGEEIHSSITHTWLIVSRERIEKQPIETVIDEDDEPDRPLDEQDALLQDLLPINENSYMVFRGSVLNLADEAWSYGNANNEGTSRSMILECLYQMGDFCPTKSVDLSYHFLTSSGPTLPDDGDSTSHLRTTLHAIGNLPSLRSFTVEGLPGSPETINTRILLESMIMFRNDLESLELTNIQLRSSSEVQLLAEFLSSRGRALAKLSLKGIIPVINQDMAGFLDPILLAMKSLSGAGNFLPSYFEVSGGDGVSVSTVSLIREAALNRFVARFNAENKQALYLKGLGLGDSHVKLIAELLPNVNIWAIEGESASLSLNLQSNPAIGLPGYEALLAMLNRDSDIEQIRVDDAGWTATYKMAVHMNTKHGRGEFMEGGVFPDKVTWMDWVIRLAIVLPAEEMEEEEAEVEEGKEEEDEKQEFETRQLNYIWYTLLQKPDFITN